MPSRAPTLLRKATREARSSMISAQDSGMRSLINCIVAVFATLTLPAAPNPWQQILNSVGLTADIQVVREAAALEPDWRANVESGGLLILEGVNAIGFKMTAKK